MTNLNTESLRSNFSGDILQPGNPGYDSARRIWNASVDKRPALIAQCTGTADVITAVTFARDNNLLTAVRGGGHNVGGRALCDEGIVIDLSRMRGVSVDPHDRVVRVQGGATLGDLDRETHAFGLAVPCGVVPKTGIAGLTLGGGVGWLIRKYGMTIDNLVSCQVVNAHGKVLTASATENDDLFWALRGGGGNFGVVTSLVFRAHSVHTIIGGLVLYPRPAATDVIRNFRDYIESAPDEITAYAALLHAPDGTPMVGVAVCYCGDPEEGDRVLRPLRGFGTPLVDTVAAIPFPAMQSLFAPSFPDGNYNYWKSSLHAELSDEAIETVVARGNLMQSPLSAVVIEYYAGAAGRVPNDATAFPYRDLPWDIVIAAQWTDARETPTHRDWARGTENALRPFATGAHILAALDVDDAVPTAFGANLPRLSAIKGKYDPENFFRVNQNIKPALAQSVRAD